MEDNKRIANTLHTLLCNKHHIPEDGISSDENCCWYLEEQISTCWDEPDHVEYLVYANAFIETMEVQKLDKAINMFMKVCSDISFASRSYPEASDILHKMIVKSI